MVIYKHKGLPKKVNIPRLTTVSLKGATTGEDIPATKGYLFEMIEMTQKSECLIRLN